MVGRLFFYASGWIYFLGGSALMVFSPLFPWQLVGWAFFACGFIMIIINSKEK